MNNITINWSAEDRARIDKLIALLEAQASSPCRCNDGLDSLLHPPKAEAETPAEATETPQEAPAPVEQEQTPPAVVEAKDEPKVTKQDILQKVIALCGAGKKAETKDIITTYADSVSDLPESALVEVWDKLTALEG